MAGWLLHKEPRRLASSYAAAHRTSIDGIVEVFNVFNRANDGAYVTDEASRQFGQPDCNANLAYAPRTLQLGFRLTF